MPSYEDGHRRVSPGRESNGTDWYTVLRYDPTWQLCDLAPASSNQRGIIRSVPIAQPFGGAWELQTFHDPVLERIVEPAHWGECPRGPRWGTSLPIQEGDMARVSFAGEGSSDPVIVGFMRWRGDYGIPWVANQVLAGIENDYTEQTPLDDDLLPDRWDILLPSGAWVRSTESGSWTIATAPVHRPVAWASLDGVSGKIKIKARNDDNYHIHAEFDPVSLEGRIAIGVLEDSSFIEFKDGNIRIRAKGDFKVYANNAEFNLTDQGAVEGAFGALTKVLSHIPQEGEVEELLAQAVGELTVQSDDPFQAKSVINNSQLTGAGRNQLNDIALNPEPVRDRVLSGFQDGQGTAAIARRLTQTIGADVLTGRLTQIDYQFDPSSLRLATSLGVPTWAVQGAAAIARENALPQILNLVQGLSNSDVLSQLSQFTGAGILNGQTITAARQALNQAVPSEFSQQVQQVLSAIGSIPLASTVTGAGGGVDLAATVSQLLGRYVLQGNRRLGGAAQLFDYEALGNLPVSAATIARVIAIARQVESFVGNPYPATTPNQLTDEQILAINQFGAAPAEVRDLIANLPPEQRPAVRDLIRVPPETLQNQYQYQQTPIAETANLIAVLPEYLKVLLEEFEGWEVLGELRTPPDAEAIRDPRLIEGLPEMVIESHFAGAAAGAGVFWVRVASYALFSQDPELPAPLEPWEPREFHLVTEATEIERFTEYGNLNMPDYW
jgi:hypothetical protein